MAPKKLLSTLFLLAIATAGCANPPGTGPDVVAPEPVSSQAYYAAGRVWEYSMNTTVAGQTMAGSFKISVDSIKDGKATLSISTTMPPAPAQTHTTTVDMNDSNSFTNATQVGSAAQGDAVVKSTTNESVTVPAGTYNATKQVSEITHDGVAATVETWLVDGLGMVKQTMTMKPTAASAPGMPDGVDLSSTTKMELTKFTK